MDNDAGTVRVIYDGASQMTIITSSYIGEAHGYCVYHPVCTCRDDPDETPSEECVQTNHNFCRLCRPESIYPDDEPADVCVNEFNPDTRWISCQPAYD